MQNFISLCRLIEPAKRAGYWLTVSKTDHGTTVMLYAVNEKTDKKEYYNHALTENELGEALEAVRAIIAVPTPVYPNGELLEFDGVEIVVSGDWENGTMFVTAEGDFFNLLSSDQVRRIENQLTWRKENVR